MTSSDGDIETMLTRSDVGPVPISRSEKARNFYLNWIYAPTMIVLADVRGVVGIIVLGFYLLMGTVGTLLVESPIGAAPGPIRMGPFQDWNYPLGTDHLGNGMLALTVHSTPSMFIMIGAGAVFSTMMATFFGTIAGYKGGRWDQVLSAVTDIVLTIPGLPLIIVLAATIEPKRPVVIGLLLTITTWAGLARMIRSETLSIRHESYVEASRVMNAPNYHIILRDVLPNLMPYIMINFTKSARSVIFSSVALYFLGVLPFSTLNWGIMLNTAFREGAMFQLRLFYWLAIPMITIVGLTSALILLSQSFDRVFNPRARVRHAGGGETS